MQISYPSLAIRGGNARPHKYIQAYPSACLFMIMIGFLGSGHFWPPAPPPPPSPPPPLPPPPPAPASVFLQISQQIQVRFFNTHRRYPCQKHCNHNGRSCVHKLQDILRVLQKLVLAPRDLANALMFGHDDEKANAMRSISRVRFRGGRATVDAQVSAGTPYSAGSEPKGKMKWYIPGEYSHTRYQTHTHKWISYPSCCCPTIFAGWQRTSRLTPPPPRTHHPSSE